MREAIGASWIMMIVVAFIALFSGYLAYSVNYSKAFRMKEGIIERIEKHNGPNKNAVDDIATLMDDVVYRSKGRCSRVVNDDRLSTMGVTGNNASIQNPRESYSYCIQKMCTKKSPENTKGKVSSAYYKVIVFFSLSLPFVDQITTFQIQGETNVIAFPTENGGLGINLSCQ